MHNGVKSINGANTNPAPFFDVKTNKVIISTVLFTIATMGAIFAALNTQAVMNALPWIISALSSEAAAFFYLVAIPLGILGSAAYFLEQKDQQKAYAKAHAYDNLPIYALKEKKEVLQKEIDELNPIYLKLNEEPDFVKRDDNHISRLKFAMDSKQKEIFYINVEIGRQEDALIKGANCF